VCRNNAKIRCKFGHPLDIFLSTHTYRLYLQPDCDISDVLIHRVAQKCNVGLQELTLRGFLFMGDRTLEQLSVNCPNLKFLDLASCSKITDRGVTHLARNCPKLRKLVLNKCTRVSHRGIVEIARNCKKLRLLDLTGTRYCEESLDMLLENCHKLQCISLFNTPMDVASVQNLLEETRCSFDDDSLGIDKDFDLQWENPKEILISALEQLQDVKKSK